MASQRLKRLGQNFSRRGEMNRQSLQVLWENASTVVRNLSDEPRSVCTVQTRLYLSYRKTGQRWRGSSQRDAQDWSLCAQKLLRKSLVRHPQRASIRQLRELVETLRSQVSSFESARGVPRQNSSQVVQLLLDPLEEDLSDTQEDPQSPMSQVVELDESDRETVVASEMGAQAELDSPTVQDEDVIFGEIPQRVLREAFASLDSVNVEEDFVTRACVMKSPPRFPQGAYRSAMRIALSEADRARDAARAWKFFLFLPQILFFRPPRGGVVHKSGCSNVSSYFLLGVGWLFWKQAGSARTKQLCFPVGEGTAGQGGQGTDYDPDGRAVRGTSRFGR